ncbi:MAG: lipoprotein-releasing system ATP-binding protein LolD [Methanomicrobiales archaeon HGW-Methanomicrobiales-4]|nr:MAG: lipoprotein-releasing system ATP-binding protein LolD [Methanomicrobiales archaeon HGW-Methanomicrobiales-4]
MSGAPVIAFDNVVKIYHLPAGDVLALDQVSFSIQKGEFVSIMGPSGSGKSTLLNLMGCLDTPLSGTITINGTDISTLNDDDLTHLRRDEIGFVFQYFNLFPLLNVIENVLFPYTLTKKDITDKSRAITALAAVGLEKRLYTNTPTELSGGQQQRVAIARSLVNDPAIILCDEPTGNLDSKTGSGIMDLMTELNKTGRTIIMVTHDPNIAAYSQRTIQVLDGRIV